MIGALLLAGGVFGPIAEFAGDAVVLAIMALMAFAAAPAALGPDRLWAPTAVPM